MTSSLLQFTIAVTYLEGQQPTAEKTWSRTTYFNRRCQFVARAAGQYEGRLLKNYENRHRCNNVGMIMLLLPVIIV